MNQKGSFDSVDCYVEQVCKHVKAKEMHPDIQLEMKSHLEDLIEDKLSEGQSIEEATRLALAQMGNPDLIGKQLHTAHKPVFEWSLAVIVAIMVGLGLIAMYALQVAYNGQNSRIYGSLFMNKAFFSGIGVLLLVVIYFLDYRKMRKYSWYLYGVTVVLLLICSEFGIMINGMKRWMIIGGMTWDIYQLSTYLFMIAFAGMLLGKEKVKQTTYVKAKRLVIEVFFIVLVPTLLYIKGNSFHDFISYAFGLLILLLFVAKAYKLFFTGMAALGVIGIGLTLNMGYQVHSTLDRYFSFKMWYDPDGLGYHQQNAIDVIRQAGLWGHGFGVTNDRLPYLHSEMVYSYLIYSFGWVFGGILLLLTVLFLFKSFNAIRSLKDPYAKGIGSTMLSIIGFHFIWNILMTLGIVPMTSFDMPFVSYGGMSGILQLMGIGIILSVCRRRNMISQFEREIHV